MYAPGISEIRNIGYRDRTVGMPQGVYHSKVVLSNSENEYVMHHTHITNYVYHCKR